MFTSNLKITQRASPIILGGLHAFHRLCRSAETTHLKVLPTLTHFLVVNPKLQYYSSGLSNDQSCRLALESGSTFPTSCLHTQFRDGLNSCHVQPRHTTTPLTTTHICRETFASAYTNGHELYALFSMSRNACPKKYPISMLWFFRNRGLFQWTRLR